MKDDCGNKSIIKNNAESGIFILFIVIVSVVIFAGWVLYDVYEYRTSEDKKWSDQCVYEAQLSVFHPNQWTTEKFNQPIDFCQVKLYKYDNGTSSTFYVRYSDDYRTQFHKVSIQTQLDCEPVGFNDKVGKFVCSSGKFAKEIDDL